MAKAEKKDAVTKVVTTVVEPAKIVLELTEDEAMFLRVYVGANTGDIGYDIYNVLQKVTPRPDGEYDVIGSDGRSINPRVTRKGFAL